MPARTLVALTIYRDHDRIEPCLRTLVTHRGEANAPFLPAEAQLYLLDSCANHGETDILGFEPTPDAVYGSLQYAERVGLPQALNDAAQEALDRGFEYLAWIHPDMDFSPDPDWLNHCIRHLELDDTCGKASPLEMRTTWEARRYFEEVIQFLVTRTPEIGNACPWVMRTSDIAALIEADGYFFDPGFELLAYEDWDMINRLVTRLGRRPHILPWTVVSHTGMGTRSKQDYGDTFERNRGYYESKWGIMGGHL